MKKLNNNDDDDDRSIDWHFTPNKPFLQDSSSYEADRCHVFTCDVSSSSPSFPFPPQSLDFIILIFVLSAIKPDKLVFYNDIKFWCFVLTLILLFRNGSWFPWCFVLFLLNNVLVDSCFHDDDVWRSNSMFIKYSYLPCISLFEGK